MADKVFMPKALLTQIADAIRSKKGTTAKIPTTDMPNMISSIETGVDITGTTLDSSSQMLSGVKALNKNGVLTTGSIKTRTASNLTVNGATVTALGGFYASNVSTDVAKATLAKPVISLNTSTGKITASMTQSAGYVSGGTTTADAVQMTTQSATTITPSTDEQTAVNSGVYTTGAIKVNPIPSQYVVPSGTFPIDSNGKHNVKNYEFVNVAVPESSSGGNGKVAVVGYYEGYITFSNSQLCVDFSNVISEDVGEILSVTIFGMCDKNYLIYDLVLSGDSKERSWLTMVGNDVAPQTYTNILYTFSSKRFMIADTVMDIFPFDSTTLPFLDGFAAISYIPG